MFDRKAWRDSRRDVINADRKRYYDKHHDSIIKAQTERIATKKRWLVEVLGGCCSICGYNGCIAALDVHHINGREKELTRSVKYQSWAYLKQNLLDLQLLCANCHREVHHKSEKTEA
jgi:5-methylcytosine-specific restriction endonuclease McrA